MFFTQLDTIIEINHGQSLRAIKNLTLSEEYLQDHFPGFPVMPGVMMLEALTQACCWLVRASEDFEHSMVVLQEARNVKYSGFVEPGQQLELSVEWFKENGNEITFKGSASIAGRNAVSARLILKKYNLSESQPDQVSTDALIRKQMKEMFARLHRAEPAEAT